MVAPGWRRPDAIGFDGPEHAQPDATRITPPSSSVSITLDRCRDDQTFVAVEELPRDHEQNLTRSGAPPVGSVSCQMMEGPDQARSAAVPAPW